MKPIIIFAIVIIHMALISYGIGVITEQIKHRVTRTMLLFLALGLSFDLIATVCMVVGAGKGYLTRHSILGYSCLLTMAVDSALVLRHRLKCGDQEVPRALHLFSRYAYCWWVIGAYLLGGFLAYLSVSAAS